LDLKGRKVDHGEIRIMMNSIACILHRIVRMIKSRRMRWGRGRGEMFTGFWLGGPKVRDHWEDLRRRWEDNIKLDLREIGIDGGELDSAGSG
jgi:hypothetical protein